MNHAIARIRSVHATARTLKSQGQDAARAMSAVIVAMRECPGREAESLELMRLRDEWNRIVARVAGEAGL